MYTTGGGEVPQKALEERRTTRDKPCEKSRGQCFGRRERHSPKALVRKGLMCPGNVKKINVSETEQTEETTGDEK